MKNVNFCSSPRKAKVLTKGIYGIFRGLKIEPDAEIGEEVTLFKGLLDIAINSRINGIILKRTLLIT